MEYKVLLAEDEKSLRDIVSTYLTRKGFDVYAVCNGEEAIMAVEKNIYDIIILDIMMPKKSGIDVCKYIRKKYDVPVIFLTALNAEQDVINGYEVGADEYITKPVSMVILEAKVNALIKRYKGLLIRDGIIRVGDLKIEPARRLVTVSEKIITLAPKEYELLIYLMENKNQILTREQILNHVWGPEYDGYDRAVDTHIKKLRAALIDSSYHVVTVIKKGYMWEE
ncbi:MAG: response regulator transcription factor [Lachnospiraceae bacterium]|nr:response regulator transcription factor [Lachnospiraceae bacterium]